MRNNQIEQSQKKVTIHDQEGIRLSDKNTLTDYIQRLALKVATQSLEIGDKAENQVKQGGFYVSGYVYRSRKGYIVYAETGRASADSTSPVLSVDVKASTLGKAAADAIGALNDSIQRRGFFKWLFS